MKKLGNYYSLTIYLYVVQWIQINSFYSDPSMLDEQYSLYSVKIPSGPRPAVRGGSYDGTR